MPARVAGALLLGAAVLAGAYGFFTTATKPSTRADQQVVPVVVSGTAQLRETATGAHERWSNAPVTISLDGSLDELGPTAKDAVRSAFGAWIASGVALPPLTFDSRTDAAGAVRDGVNRIVYGPIWLKGHESDLAVTIGYEETASGEIVEADTIFNSSYPFAVLPSEAAEESANLDEATCRARYDLQNVATHEAGHFFGLGEDMEDERTTMFIRSLPCQTHKRALTAPDRAVMNSLYSQPVSAARHGCAVAAPAPAPTRAGAVALLLLTLGAARRTGRGRRPCREIAPPGGLAR